MKVLVAALGIVLAILLLVRPKKRTNRKQGPWKPNPHSRVRAYDNSGKEVDPNGGYCLDPRTKKLVWRDRVH